MNQIQYTERHSVGEEAIGMWDALGGFTAEVWSRRAVEQAAGGISRLAETNGDPGGEQL
jgi:hypothetical protein